jgi:polyhydroxyalkanoate synthesis regulator phasin
MANQIGFKEQEQQEQNDLSTAVDAARLLVQTLRDLNDRVNALEEEVQYLKNKHHQDG